MGNDKLNLLHENDKGKRVIRDQWAFRYLDEIGEHLALSKNQELLKRHLTTLSEKGICVGNIFHPDQELIERQEKFGLSEFLPG